MKKTHIYWPINVSTADLSHKKIEFAWDIHETLARKKKSECAAITLRYWPTLIKNARSLRMGIKKIAKKEEYIAAEAYAYYFEQHNHEKLARYIKEVANAYRPIKGINTLIKELSEKGYTHRLASNIGCSYLPIIVERFTDHYHNSLFDYMNGGTIVDYGIPNQTTEIKGLTGTIYCATECKPKSALFQLHNQHYNPDNGTIIIFIDDKLKNVEAASHNGWIGIKFSSVKRLRADLSMLGLL